MHKYYDPRLFDLMSEQEIFAERAVASDGSNLPTAATGEALALSGVDVRFFGAMSSHEDHEHDNENNGNAL